MAVALGCALAITGCGADRSRSADSKGSLPTIPFSAAGSIAAPEHAAVERAVRGLATAELTLSRDMVPLQGHPFDSYLRGLAGASATTRRTVEQIASGGGNCRQVNSAVSAASAGVTRALDSALRRFNGRISLAQNTLKKVDADRAAVAKAAAELKRALAADPGAWQVPGVDETGSTLAGIASWQLNVASAIPAAQHKAASYTAIRNQVYQRAAGVGTSCNRAASREQVRATTRAAAPTTQAASQVARTFSPAPRSSSPDGGGAPSGPTSSTPVAPTSSTTAPPSTSPSATPTPTETTPSPSPSTSTSSEPSPSDSDTPSTSPSSEAADSTSPASSPQD